MTARWKILCADEPAAALVAAPPEDLGRTIDAVAGIVQSEELVPPDH